MPKRKASEQLSKAPVKRPRRRTMPRKSFDQITKPVIRRLAMKAGVKRMSALSYQPIRDLIRDLTEGIMKQVTEITWYRKVKQVSEGDVQQAIIALRIQELPSCSKPKAKVSYCAEIPKAVFERCIKEAGQEYMDDLRYSKAAMAQIQLTVEKFVIYLLEYANLSAINAKRVTLMKKDIQMAIRAREGFMGSRISKGVPISL